MSLVRNANSIQSIFDTAKSTPEKGQISTQGLIINVHGEDSNITNWLDDNFAFMCDAPSPTASDLHTVSAHCSDSKIKEVIAILDSGQFEKQVYSRRGIVFHRVQISSHMNIDYLPSLGCAWITQQSGWLGKNDPNLVVLVYSSRTPLPFQELRIGLIDIINRYFESQKWHTFHAGAVGSISSSKTIMIVGASHSGKTSLILELITKQFQFIGNERLFCKLSNDRVHIRSFPQPVNIGIGSAHHHESLRELIDRPDRCSYYQNRFEPARVWNTPRDQLSHLPDKLKLLPGELTSAMNATPPSPSGVVDAIIVPSIGDEPKSVAEILTAEEVKNVLTANYFASANDQIYPRWLPITYDYHANMDPTSVIEQLSRIPAWRIRYQGSNTEAILPVFQELGLT